VNNELESCDHNILSQHLPSGNEKKKQLAQGNHPTDCNLNRQLPKHKSEANY